MKQHGNKNKKKTKPHRERMSAAATKRWLRIFRSQAKKKAKQAKIHKVILDDIFVQLYRSQLPIRERMLTVKRWWK